MQYTIPSTTTPLLYYSTPLYTTPLFRGITIPDILLECFFYFALHVVQEGRVDEHVRVVALLDDEADLLVQVQNQLQCKTINDYVT
jgi:hypothetical protein